MAAQLTGCSYAAVAPGEQAASPVAAVDFKPANGVARGFTAASGVDPSD